MVKFKINAVENDFLENSGAILTILVFVWFIIYLMRLLGRYSSKVEKVRKVIDKALPIQIFYMTIGEMSLYLALEFNQTSF